MQTLKNIFVGFLVSFVGSIPLGYLNIVGFQILKKSGLNDVFYYLLGVVFIEMFVIYFTLLFAKRLISNEKLLKFIEGFSIIFMFLLAYVFYTSSTKDDTSQTFLTKYFSFAPFVIGLIFSSFNFIQLPFWTSWNLYLLNGKYIEVSKNRKYFYVFGTVIGTFSGMLVLILSLKHFTNHSDFLAKYLLKIIIPFIFIALGILQSFKFYKKYSK